MLRVAAPFAAPAFDGGARAARRCVVMLIEVVAEVAIGALRIAGRVLAEIFLHGIVEIGVQGIGYLLCRPFNRNVQPDRGLATTVGLVFWLLVGIAGYLVYTTYLASGES